MTPCTAQRTFRGAGPRTDDQGNKIGVFLPIALYNEIMELLEELEDIRLYDEVIAREETSIPFDEYVKNRSEKEMNGYAIRIKKTAQKQLDKLSSQVADVLIQAIYELAIDPRPPGCKKLKGRNAYRIRKGDYRIILDRRIGR